MSDSDLLTTKEAAKELELSVVFVRQLCQRRRMNSIKIGRDWLIPRSAVEEYQRTRRPPGRPRKSPPEE